MALFYFFGLSCRKWIDRFRQCLASVYCNLIADKINGKKMLVQRNTFIPVWNSCVNLFYLYMFVTMSNVVCLCTCFFLDTNSCTTTNWTLVSNVLGQKATIAVWMYLHLFALPFHPDLSISIDLYGRLCAKSPFIYWNALFSIDDDDEMSTNIIVVRIDFITSDTIITIWLCIAPLSKPNTTSSLSIIIIIFWRGYCSEHCFLLSVDKIICQHWSI